MAGTPLWFESTDLPLANNLEGFGSALLFAAASKKRRLAFASPPDSVWARNIHRALSKAAEWWGYPSPFRLPDQLPLPVPEAKPSPAGGGVLCFTGGVDSFYTLLRGGQRVETILFIHGYDVPLQDVKRAAIVDASLRTIAGELGLRAIVLRTNLRVHPALDKSNWGQVHGGALAAAGHMLANHTSRLLISASYPFAFDRPWGSHWALDPWWSSSRLAVAHVGAEKWRAEKLVALLDEPLVQTHLRVCWENRVPAGNCGCCEKCLRTMLILDSQGRLEDFPVFPPAATLAHNLGQLPRLRPDLIRVYATFLESSLSSAVRAAVAALVQRSQPRPETPVRWYQRHRHD